MESGIVRSEEEIKAIQDIADKTGFDVDQVADAFDRLVASANRATFEITNLIQSLPMPTDMRQFEPKKGGKRRGSRRWRNGKR